MLSGDAVLAIRWLRKGFPPRGGNYLLRVGIFCSIEIRMRNRERPRRMARPLFRGIPFPQQAYLIF